MIDFECPHCGTEIHAAESAVGKKGKCKKCQKTVVVPEVSPRQEVLPPPLPESDKTPDAKESTVTATKPDHTHPLKLRDLLGIGFGLVIVLAVLSCCGVLPRGWPFFRSSASTAVAPEGRAATEPTFKVDVFVDDSVAGVRVDGQAVQLSGIGGVMMLKAGPHEWTAIGSDKWKAFCEDEWKSLSPSDARKSGQFEVSQSRRNLLILSMFSRTDSKPATPPEKDTVGIWNQEREPLPGRITIYKLGNKHVMGKIHPDGGVETHLMVERTDDAGRKFFKARKCRPENDFYLIDGSDDLQVWSADTDGKHVLVVTAKRVLPR